MGKYTSSIVKPLAITGCGVLSPMGIGFRAFADAFCAGLTRNVSLNGYFEEPLPVNNAHYMADFAVRDYLGKKGTSFFDRLTSLTVVACDLALQDSGLAISGENEERVGLVLGTSIGSLKSASDYSRETLVQERPYLVNPILFPNTILNCAAGQAAIWHSLKGMNATVAGGALSAISALRYAGMSLRQGYADVLLVGGVEEFTPHSAWSLHHMGLLTNNTTGAGEGCAVFVLEEAATVYQAGRSSMGEILACEIKNYGPDWTPSELTTGLAYCIRRALERSGIAPTDIWAIISNTTEQSVLCTVESQAIDQELPQGLKHHIHVKNLLGECYSAMGAFQLTALLALHEFHKNETNRPVSLLLSIDEGGGVACTVIKGGIG